MRISLIAFDSLGVRSSASYIEIGALRIFIDPSAALAPLRYGLPPHPRELEELRKKLKEIELLLEKTDVIINTHYHYDHHDPGWRLPPDIYKDKTVLVKDPNQYINFSQRKRAYRYLNLLKNHAREIMIADSMEFRFGDIMIRFSEPIPHGHNDKLGYVIQVLINDGEKSLLYTSDVEGPCLESQIEAILRWRPNIIILDGPSTYLAGYKYPQECVAKSIENIRKIAALNPEFIVIDHHLVRDSNYPSIIKEVSFKNMGTAAFYMGRQENLLEANRKKLYEEEPVEGSSKQLQDSMNGYLDE